MRTVPIPGKILRTNLFLGLTFNELVTLGTIPLVVVLPSLYVGQIPLPFSIGIVVIMAILVGGVIVQTPEGQTPLSWAPAAFKRRITPDTYYLKARAVGRGRVKYLDVVQTVDELGDNSTVTDQQAIQQSDEAEGDECRRSNPTLGM
ncbi:MAG: hypothetical protein ACOCR6_00460 [archaeon]